MRPEDKLYQRIKENWTKDTSKPGFFRIENSVSSGLPDIYLCNNVTAPFWIETKCCSGTNVQLRKFQWTTIRRMQTKNVPVFVLNYDPKQKRYTVYSGSSIEVVEGKKDHVKITSTPEIKSSNLLLTYQAILANFR